MQQALYQKFSDFLYPLNSGRDPGLYGVMHIKERVCVGMGVLEMVLPVQTTSPTF